jgi:hypothetical protein
MTINLIHSGSDRPNLAHGQNSTSQKAGDAPNKEVEAPTAVREAIDAPNKEVEARTAVREAISEAQTSAKGLQSQVRTLQANMKLLRTYMDSCSAHGLEQFNRSGYNEVVYAAAGKLMGSLHRARKYEDDHKELQVKHVVEAANAHAALLPLLEAQHDNRLLPLLRRVGDPAPVIQWQREVDHLHQQLHDIVLKARGKIDKALPAADGTGLHQVVGTTHIINGDSFYIDNKVVTIPDKYKKLYCTPPWGPNTLVVHGHFRFKGNTSGNNAFGTTLNVELYECDEVYSNTLLLRDSVWSEHKQFDEIAGSWLDNAKLEETLGLVQNFNMRRFLDCYDFLVEGKVPPPGFPKK